MFEKEKIKILLPVHLYDLTIIHLSKLEKASQYIYENIDTINSMESYEVMLPNIYELNHSVDDYVYKYGQIIKNFIDHPKKKYLVTNNLILDALIKENKREVMFKFFQKKNKNILVFTNNDMITKYVPKDVKGYKVQHYKLNTWQEEFKIFDKFKIIKEDTYKAYEVFKYDYWNGVEV